jgi:high affinity sulfate transporter 1
VFFQGLLPLDRARIPADAIAGVTLAALAIPEVMGYTKIAGMPVITGLYTILLPLIVFAVLGSSRHLVVGADSATAAILAAGLAGMAATGSPHYVALAGMLAILAGGFLIAARLLRLGFLADFLSRSVLIGFLTGVGVQVACGQIAGMLGVTKSSGGALEQGFDAVTDIGKADLDTVLVSGGVLLTILLGGRLAPKVPWALLAVVGSIVASSALDLSSHGVTVLGTVPSGLPSLGVPDVALDDIPPLVGIAFALFIVILAQSAATSRAYATRYADRFSENTDLVGLSVANVSAGLSGTFVVNGSPTKTEMVDSAGGRSQLAQLSAAAVVVVVLLFLTEPLSDLPNAVLAAIVFLIAVRLIDIRGMMRIYRQRPVEFGVALITTLTVIVIGVEQGIILAIVLSVIIHLRHSYRPLDQLVIETPDGIRTASLADGTQARPGLAIYFFSANLYYANAERLSEELLGLADQADPKLRWICLSADAIGDVDYTGSATLREVHDQLADRGVTLVLSGLMSRVSRQLGRDGILELVGEDHVFPHFGDAIKAYESQFGTIVG